MRAFEFLIEKNLSGSDFYKKPRLDALLSKLSQNDDFIVDRQPTKLNPTKQELAQLKQFYQYYDEKGETRKSTASQNLPKTLGGVELSRIAKTAEFGGRGGDSPEKANIGPVVEILKAAAIFTKLTDRTNDPVSIDKIKTVIDELKNRVTLSKSSKKSKVEVFKGSLSKEVNDVGRNINDHITLDVTANEGSFKRAMSFNPDDAQVQGIIKSILNYVNTESDLSRYNKFFSTNNRIDSLNVAIVGGEGKKTDVKTTYIDPDTKEPRTLKTLSMSLKAGKGATLDQASGSNEDGVRNFFEILGLGTEQANAAIAQTKFIGKTRNVIATPEEHAARVKAATQILSIAAKNLEARYFSKNDAGEAQFVKEFLQNLIKSMTKDESLIYVEFNPNGTYNKLNPRKIQHLASDIDLYGDLKVSGGGVSYLYIRDKISGKSLFHIRLMVSKAERIAFFFELDDLLELVQAASTKIDNTLKAPAPKQQPAAPGAVAAQPVPATQ
jgi:hypothetical protein